MLRRRRDFEAAISRRAAVIGFAVLTAIACAVTVHLAHRVSLAASDERALARAQTCATEGAGDRDCVDDMTGVAVGSPQQMYRSQKVKLTVVDGGKQTTLTFPDGVAPVFLRIQDGDVVELTAWHGDIVAVTAQGDTEKTPKAPSEQHRSRLTAAFFGAGFTVVLAGLTLLSLVMAESFFEGSLRQPGVVAASVVIFGGFATTFGAIVIMAGGSVAGAVSTAVAILATGVAGAAGTWLWRRLGVSKRRLRRDREAVRLLKTGPGS